MHEHERHHKQLLIPETLPTFSNSRHQASDSVSVLSGQVLIVLLKEKKLLDIQPGFCLSHKLLVNIVGSLTR